jgi:hypothetical protein
MLMLVSPPQQQFNRPLQQRHAPVRRDHSTSRHNMQHDVHTKNSTLVVGETFCLSYAACLAALVAWYLLFSLQLLDAIAIRRCS